MPSFLDFLPTEVTTSTQYSSQRCADLCLVALLCPALCNPMDWGLPGSSVHGDSPGKDTGVGCHALLQGIFPTQGSNPGLLHWQVGSLPTELPGKPHSSL